MHADASIFAGHFDGPEQAQHAVPPNRKAYVHLIRGSLVVNGIELSAGDALMVAQESLLQLSQGTQAEVLVFDLRST
jgi:redox-sensitive bicupin YhaK (pirin superfamily)